VLWAERALKAADVLHWLQKAVEQHGARQHLFHYKERTSETEDDKKKAILDQCRIAGAINVLLLKLVGYSGLMRVSTFEGVYR
jgi:hypothetical protein